MEEELARRWTEESARANEMAARLSMAEYFITDAFSRNPDIYEEIVKHHASERKPLLLLNEPKNRASAIRVVWQRTETKELLGT
jgi:hypothetical protein